MLHHYEYVRLCRDKLGWIVNHDDRIPEAKLEKYVVDTETAWKARNKKRVEAEKKAKEDQNKPSPPPEKIEMASIATEVQAAVSKKPSLKNRVKSFLSRKKRENKATVAPALVITLAEEKKKYSRLDVLFYAKPYCPIERMFPSDQYNPGEYGKKVIANDKDIDSDDRNKLLPLDDQKKDTEGLEEEDKNDADNEEDEKKKANYEKNIKFSEEEMEKPDHERKLKTLKEKIAEKQLDDSVFYDKEKISFHDKSKIFFYGIIVSHFILTH